MSSAVVAEWIKRVAEEERGRDTVRAKQDEMAARKAAFILRNGRQLIDALRATVTRDAEAFRDEFSGDRARDIAVEAIVPSGGFVVRRPAPAATSLTVIPNVGAATIACHYRFAVSDGLPPLEDRIDLTFAAVDGETLETRHQTTGQVFATADALSEFLLVPVLTARSR